jgi:predicted 2-oxoglutarate/Fe(II)-dependent dioxygenase YbiX
MFGSLVVLMPFDHTGGELILRHRGREFTFDGCALLENAPTTSAAYVAFFSDVEHEVTEVTSGHRVTITYNLYFDATKGGPCDPV